MDINFVDPSDIPLANEDVRIRSLSAEPHPDGRRVKVTVDITPFQNKPSGEIIINDHHKNQVASISFIETMDAKFSLTLHLRSAEIVGQYDVKLILYYVRDMHLEESESGEPFQIPEKIVVDKAKTTFSIV